VLKNTGNYPVNRVYYSDGHGRDFMLVKIPGERRKGDRRKEERRSAERRKEPRMALDRRFTDRRAQWDRRLNSIAV
jgi:hypothetical protein